MAHSPPSQMEAEFYYAGLPSNPLLVARTGSAWEAPRGPEAYPVRKELRPVGNHPLADVWEDNLALKLHALLDSMDVEWTSTDVVRIGLADEPSAPAPVILWIGVFPESLSGEDGVAAAYKCRDLLVEFNITDVEVEIRESVVTRSARAGPKLLTPSYSSEFTVHFREPFTPTLGIPICAQTTPWAEGTGGFFIAEGEGRNTKGRLLLVTARHVVFPLNKYKNNLFVRKNDSEPRYNVRLFGDAAFITYLESIKTEIGDREWLVQDNKKRIEEVEGKDRLANEERQKAQAELGEAQKRMEKVKTFHKYMLTQWTAPESRVLGHVILSPPISVGSSSSDEGEGYTEDWAVIEIDASKIDASNFNGNAIDLGTRIPSAAYRRMMHPNIENAHGFTYPRDRLLRLRDTIPEDQMRRPTAIDQNGEPCLMVLKRGCTSGLTIGRANNICSYARYYYPYYNWETSKEWAILPRNSESGPFSKSGDSGSVIVDGRGRMGGLLTGGTGKHAFLSKSQLDITYATPVDFILKRMQEHGLHKPHVNPVLAA